MERFRSGATQVLVATTVVEVGVDVPNACAMVVVDAERFGLATLHQLRGRVGRGEHRGHVSSSAGSRPAGTTPRRRRACRRLREARRTAFALAEARPHARATRATCSG